MEDQHFHRRVLVFDLPLMRLAGSVGLRELADAWLSVSTDKGANAGFKIASLVAGMLAGADSIVDMARLRHGGTGKLFANAYAPSTLGSFLTGIHVPGMSASAVLWRAACWPRRPPRTARRWFWASSCPRVRRTRPALPTG